MDHAFAFHGSVAEQARNNLSLHGAFRLYLESQSHSIHQLTKDQRGYVFDVVIRKVNGKWVEVTAFQPKSGMLPDVLQWLQRKPGHFINRIP